MSNNRIKIVEYWWEDESTFVGIDENGQTNTMYGCYMADVKFHDLDTISSDIVEIEMTTKYQKKVR